MVIIQKTQKNRFRLLRDKKKVHIFAFPIERGHSSVGLERLLDRQEVTGSNPVVLTPKDLNFRIQVFFCGLFIRFGLQARGRQVKPPIDLRLIGILLHRTSLCSA